MSETPTAQTEGTEAGHGEAGQTTGTAADGGHGGSVFPPLDTSTFPSQIFWLVIFFGLLYLLMSKVALPRLGQIFHNRMARINGDIAKAQALKDETENAIKAYEKALSDARSNAQSIAAETKAKMTAEMDAERAALEKSLSVKTAEAETKIAAAKAKAMKDVGEVAADAAAEIVAELTGSKVTKAAVAKAIADVKG